VITLYGYWRSSASYRVRIALAIKGIPYKQEAVNLKTGAHKERSHLTRNPQGVLPVLELEDGTYLNQSLAIIDYLETRYPGNSLYPQDPVVKSKVLAAALIIAADISPIQNLSVLNHISDIYKADTHARAVWAAHWIENGFEAIEKLLSENKQDFYLYNTPTLFETCLVPQVSARWRPLSSRPQKIRLIWSYSPSRVMTFTPIAAITGGSLCRNTTITLNRGYA